MELVVENLRKSGVVVVVSAGNDEQLAIPLRHVPAIYEGSFSVVPFIPITTSAILAATAQ